jgi:hypothetical protein
LCQLKANIDCWSSTLAKLTENSPKKTLKFQISTTFQVTYVGAVLSGDLIFWQYCYERYTQLRRDKDNLDERIELLKALGVTKDAWLQNRLLTYVMTLPSAEITPTLEAIASTPTGEI